MGAQVGAPEESGEDDGGDTSMKGRSTLHSPVSESARGCGAEVSGDEAQHIGERATQHGPEAVARARDPLSCAAFLRRRARHRPLTDAISAWLSVSER